MPTPRFNFAIATFNGKIYCIGDRSSDNVLWGSAEFFSYAVEVYDPVTNSWSAKSALPFNGSSQAHAVDGKIYVLSHSGDLRKYGDLYMYNPVADSWIKKTSIPKEPYDTGFAFASEYLVSATINNEILFTGLFSYYHEAIMYKPETGTWHQIDNRNLD